MEENGAYALINPILHTFDTVYAEKFSFTWLWENIYSCNMTYQS